MSATIQCLSATVGDFVEVSLHTLYPPAKIITDLYLPTFGDGGPRLYTTSSRPPTPAELDRLAATGVRNLLIPPAQAADFRQQLRELMAGHAELSPLSQIEIACEVAKADFAEAWQCLDATPIVQQASSIADQVVDACEREDELKGQLLSLVQHDGETFTHVTNVCAFALVLALGMGMRTRKSLMEVGTAALLHDLGKRRITTNVLRKPGALTAEEKRLIVEHPRLGFEELCARSDLTAGQLLMVYQHHEKLDGTGYPVRLAGTEIHWMGRLCAVVDVFDALTSRRAYRKPLPAQEALDFIGQGSGKHFDPEMARCWQTIMAPAISNRS